MDKNKTIKKINEMIDRLILAGKTGTPEYRRLVALHAKLTKEV